MFYGSFPEKRLRRTRSESWIRDLVEENNIRVNDLIWPCFVIEGHAVTQDIASMPNIKRYSIDILIEECKKAHDLGIRAIALFPITPAEKKTPDGRESYNPDNLMCRAVRAIKKEIPTLGIITDVALDPYTSHGHAKGEYLMQTAA